MGRLLALLNRIPTSVLIFLFFFSVYIWTMSGLSQYGDEVEKYRVAQSIVDRHDLAIRPTAMYQTTGVDQRTYSTYELGQSVLEVPFYALGRVIYSFYPQPDVNWTGMLFVGLLNPLLTALTCVALFKTSLELGFRYQTSVALTLVFGLATVAWPYSKGFTREPLLGLLILLMFYTSYRFSKTHQWRWLLMAGFLAGYLVFSKFLQSIVLPFFFVYILVSVFQRHRQANGSIRRSVLTTLQSAALFILPILVFLGLQSLYAWMRFGMLSLGVLGTRSDLPSYYIDILFASNPFAMGTRILFSSEKSIFIYSPPLLLSLVALLQWFRTQSKETLLLLGVILSTIVLAIVRPDGDGGSWWGPRYLVQITALLIIPLGVLESSRLQRFWKIILGLLFVMGLFVQVVGVMGNERDYLDVIGKSSSFLGQIDFLRHGALDSIVLSLSPYRSLVQINPYGILLGLIVTIIGVGIIQRFRQPKITAIASPFVGAVMLGFVLLIEFLGFVGWIAAPYSQVFVTQGDTRYVAANLFLADGRTCEATSFYQIALARQTTYQRQAAEQIERLWQRAAGTPMAIDNAMQWTDLTGNAKIDNDPEETIGDTASMRFSNLSNKDESALITSSPMRAQPNTLYEMSGWLKSLSIYGSGSGVVTIFEDDGHWGHGRTTDLIRLDETHGWLPFRQTLTTLPTTQRLFVRQGLFNTFGTFWVDELELVQVDPHAAPSRVQLSPCQ